jgi:hypothetical protein
MNRISRIAPFRRGRSRVTIGLAGLLLAALPLSLAAQSEVACSAAVSQLQTYANQVNSIAQAEANQGIPLRCGPNPYCAQTLYQQLSAWYAQQSALINQWYTTIARQCSPPPVQQSAASRKKQTRPTEEIDVDDLEVDDDDKTVRIRIPSSPSGYSRSRR